MCAAVEFSGIPEHVTIQQVACGLGKLFQRIRDIGVIGLTELPQQLSTDRRVIVIDFQSDHHANNAQRIINGFEYDFDGIKYTLEANINYNSYTNASSSDELTLLILQTETRMMMLLKMYSDYKKQLQREKRKLRQERKRLIRRVVKLENEVK